MKKISPWWFLLLIPFFAGFLVAVTEPISRFERAVFDLLQRLPNFFYRPMYLITEMGDAVGIIAITAVILIISAFRKRFFLVGLPVAITVIISRIINITLKNIIDRARPEFKLLEAGESSFPSGHSQNNMALYIALLLTLLIVVKAPKLRVFLKVLLIAVPIIIGITRIYFGVHYISDVIAGWSMGALIAITVYMVYFKVMGERKKENANKSI